MSSASDAAVGPSRYPPARRSDVVELYHGCPVSDPYRWLEDPDDPETLRWLREQQARSDDYLSSLPGQRHLREVLHGLISGPTASPVKVAGPRRFRVNRSNLGAAWTVQVSEGSGGDWRTAIDPSVLGIEAVVRRWQPSRGGRFLAVQVIVGGAEDVTPLSVVDVATGEVVETSTLTRHTPVEWRADEESFYYARRHHERPGNGVYLHRVGTDPVDDELVLGGDDPMSRHHVVLWHDRWLMVTVRHGASRRTRVLIADVQDDRGPVPLRLDGAAPAGVVIDSAGRALATSTANTEFGELLVAEPARTGGWQPWRVLVSAAGPAVFSGFTLVRLDDGDRLVVLRTLDGCSAMTVHDAATGVRLTDVVLPDQGTVAAINATDEPAILALSYTDWVTPLSVWHLDVRSGQVVPVEPDAVKRLDVGVTRTTYRSFDGTEVPVTILSGSRGSDQEQASRPTILTAYGGFGISFRPGFQPDGLAWVLAGGSMAIAGVRGGGERGRDWHRKGAGPNKINALWDLHAAGDWLVASGRARREQLALLGGSNGGMVVTGTMVRHPTAYAAVASVGAPLDMVRYERWGLGKAWRDEYGSADDPGALEALLRFSPYHNVADDVRRYPAALFTAGSTDTRVDPLHSRKMVARLQHAAATGPVLLNVIDGMGHTGSVGERAERLTAELLAFLAHHTGLALDGDC